MNALKKLIKKVTGQKTGRIKLKWEFNAKSSIFSEPYITDVNNDGKQEIIFGTKNGIVYVLNNEGKILWHYKLFETLTTVEELFKETATLNAIYGTPVVKDINNDKKKEILFGSELGYVYCLSYDGKILWKFKTNRAIRGSVIAEDINSDGKKEIIFGSMDKNLYVLDLAGKLIFKFEARDAIESAPAVLKTGDKVQIIFGCNDGYVYSINDLGKLNWKFKTGNRIVTRAVVASLHKDKKQYILVASTDHCLYILNENGLMDSKFETKAQLIAKPTVKDIDKDGEAEIFIGSCDDNIYALSPITQKIWRYETNFWIGSAVKVEDIDDDNKYEVIAGSYDKSLYIFDAKASFVLNHMPGISGIVKQNSDYGAMTRQAQHLRGRKLWQYNTEGVITGLAILDLKTEKNIIVNTKKGIVKCFVHVE